MKCILLYVLNNLSTGKKLFNYILLQYKSIKFNKPFRFTTLIENKFKNCIKLTQKLINSHYFVIHM